MKRWIIIIGLLAVFIAIVIISTPVLAKGGVTNVPPQRTGNGLSANWAGYVVPTTSANEAVTAISGSWTVPTVTGRGYSAIWLGMDGDNSNTLEQIGTEQDIINGKTQYYAWLEMYPSAPYDINLPINAGDTITASVQYTNGNFLFTLQDSNWQTAFTMTETPAYVPQRNSAEWIVESPSTKHGILPLANFGSVTFSGIQATIGTETGNLSNWPNVVINMGNSSGSMIAQTNGLNTAGTGFTVSYVANSGDEPGSNYTNPGSGSETGSGHVHHTDSQGNGSSLPGKFADGSQHGFGWGIVLFRR
jgi:hypothetical protein